VKSFLYHRSVILRGSIDQTKHISRAYPARRTTDHGDTPERPAGGQISRDFRSGLVW
jgi:hypothetical protein